MTKPVGLDKKACLESLQRVFVNRSPSQATVYRWLIGAYKVLSGSLDKDRSGGPQQQLQMKMC